MSPGGRGAVKWTFFTSRKALWSRRRVLVYEILVLAILLLLAAFYLTDHLGRVPAEFGGMPTGVPFFGAVGAVLISLTGVFDHPRDWDTAWEPWHYTRWLVGATVAIIAYLIFKAGVLSLQLDSAAATSDTTTDNNVLYYLVAFAVGYREETFRELMKRLFEVILDSGKSPPTITRIHPTHASRSGGKVVSIIGTQIGSASHVSFGVTAGKIVRASGIKQSPTHLLVKVPPVDQAGEVPLIVQTRDGPVVADFTYE